jgi:hypothetical protein
MKGRQRIENSVKKGVSKQKMIIRGNYDTGEITVDGIRLDPSRSQAIYNHSPDGFSFGYCGSGPAQLALALLLHAGVDEDRAVILHQNFKEQFVARLPRGNFEVSINITPDGQWFANFY